MMIARGCSSLRLFGPSVNDALLGLIDISHAPSAIYRRKFNIPQDGSYHLSSCKAANGV
jgi:hypothetical protein